MNDDAADLFFDTFSFFGAGVLLFFEANATRVAIQVIVAGGRVPIHRIGGGSSYSSSPYSVQKHQLVENFRYSWCGIDCARVGLRIHAQQDHPNDDDVS